MFRVVDDLEIAPGVFRLGPWGQTQTSAYAVRTGASWVLIDTGYAGNAARVRATTAGLFGADPPQEILLTHVHPDHSGAAADLAAAWRCPVYLHPAELPIATGDFAAMRDAAGPLDRWVLLPLLTAVGRHRRDAILAAGNLAGVARTLQPGEPVPALPGWQCLHTPGHTPGHVCYLRTSDRVLISGDALVTLCSSTA